MIICYVYLPAEMVIIPTTIMLSSFWLLFCMLITKNWMTYFKTKWTQYTMEFEWQQIINPKPNPTQNWFISNNKTFGNLSFMLRLIGAICTFGFTISAIPLTTMIYINNSASHGYSALTTFSVISTLLTFATA